jgi:serine/threonine protein kinase
MSHESIDLLKQIAAIADRFDSAWRDGRQPRIEDFLGEGPEAENPELLCDLLGIELEVRRQRGERPAPEEYLDRFPRHRALIQSAFRAERSDPSTMPFVAGYKVLRLLGSGGFSEVWLAEDQNLFGREVALKMIKPRGSPQKRQGLIAALRNEAQMLVSVRHPNLVQVFRWIECDGNPVLVIQYVAGGSLSDRLIREGALEWPAAARYVADVGEGLLAVHARGIVHRDVKPANILWDAEIDEALLTDLGVSARFGGSADLAGTIPYMAPEAFDGKASPALDVYSLAATLYTLVTAEKPFSGRAIDELKDQVARGLPDPDSRCTGLPEPFERLIRAGLSFEPEQRPDLRSFVTSLRTTLNQLLVDVLVMGRPSVGPEATTEPLPETAPVHPSEPTTEPDAGLPTAAPVAASVAMHLTVRRQQGPSTFVPVAATRGRVEAAVTRDMSKVPPPPDRLRLQTGDRIRIEVVADRPGHLTVFNVGPTGNLSMLYPDEVSRGGIFTTPVVPANQILHVHDVEMTPPAGPERLCAVWSRLPLPLRLEQLQSLVERKGKKSLASQPYVATRDMKRVQQSVQKLEPGDWHAVVLELEHSS